MRRKEYEQVLDDLTEILKTKDKLIEQQQAQIQRLQKLLDKLEELERSQIETRGRYEL